MAPGFSVALLAVVVIAALHYSSRKRSSASCSGRTLRLAGAFLSSS
jgi:hypothetical protein